MIELIEEIKNEFISHAKESLPREACGIVAVIKGKQKYFKCTNISKAIEDFILDPKDYIAVEDFVDQHGGDIVAIVHSHPSTNETPTPTDKVGCESSNLPWFIYSLKTKNWHGFEPTGYKAPLIGRKFKHGVFDCYAAMKDWYKEKLGINLIDFEREELWWEKGQNLFIDNFEKAGFYRVIDGSLEIGDIILMNLKGPIVSHCAVYIGNDQVFHQTMNRLSSREIYGGLLKKNTRMILRYKK
jgi:proteasome lid subunit RPN8/RPN11